MSEYERLCETGLKSHVDVSWKRDTVDTQNMY